MKPSILLTLLSSAVLLFPAVADALDIPSEKPGLWEIRAQNSSDGKAGGRDGTMQICMDTATMAQSKQLSDEYNRKNCSKNEIRKEGNKWIRSLVCNVGTSNVSTQQTFEFNGDSAYHAEVISTYDPPSAGRTRTHVIRDGKWLGACK